jgi:hypothetical protein
MMVCLWFLQDMYDNLCQKIEDVTRNPSSFQFEGEFEVFLNTEKINHPSIIKVINIEVKILIASIKYLCRLSISSILVDMKLTCSLVLEF